MHDLAIISTIKSISPIENRDRIVLANVENYNVIVKKDEFLVGDTVIYIFYDAVLPERPEYEFLRKSSYSTLAKGFRIRAMKMGGIISEGLVLPLSVLPEKEGGYKVGTVVTDLLEIRNYEDIVENKTKPITSKKEGRIVKAFMHYKWFRILREKLHPTKKVEYPSWFPKADEENIEKVWNDVRNTKEKFIVTEKIEGSAVVYSISNGKFHSYSHNWEMKEGFPVDGAKYLGIEKKMRKLMTLLKRYHIKHFAIAGELCGPGIQKNIYGYPSFKLFIYNAYVWNRKQSYKLKFTELEQIAELLNIPTVPLLQKDALIINPDDDTPEAMLKNSEGFSVVCEKDEKCPREGTVWRTDDGRIHFKCKSRQYKVWF